ncbi:dipeptidase [Paenibacillus sp. KQZ6P-2]|uniref:Dipeptidase n=1 Tax=Paenibacillus mangrovi TaxID=2931978 RepID=A0A9X1WL38_9BACL|nr:dipeptidase [Paenibacillus mangrovi]MCJ8010686.1 dipeptidase [Paenibacillus mangrovi]
MRIPVIDFHCDVLSKMRENVGISFLDDPKLDVTYDRMRQGEVQLQCFAIYLSERWGIPRYEYILDQIDAFKSRVMTTAEGMRWLRWKEDAAELEQAIQGSVQALKSARQLPWGLLSVEGADGFEGSLFYVKMCYELGVRFLGITWNYANWAADGVLEKRNGGFTEKGRKLIQLSNEIGLLLDVSHLSQAGFWELTERTVRPFIASHSNAKSICPHPRNLTDEQIRAIIAMDGRIGMTFVPWFVREGGEGPVRPEELLPHIEHFCTLGGENNLMIGSDFDGIDSWIQGLEHPGRYPEFAELLCKHYSEELVRKWFSGNALSYLNSHLPEKGAC